ncbi:protein CTLA-2-alpha-like [Planococcus citri]|uniref:protein CTLA-2-alpha-like n=1 Tax=Planococcus citri TaxID=170843 RepID=UPI0031F910B2
MSWNHPIIYFCVLLIVQIIMAEEKLNLDNEEWKNYKTEFNKTYENENDEVERYKIYLDNKKMVEEHNAKFAKGEVTYEMGINQFSDRKPEENSCCGLRLDKKKGTNKE